MRLKLLLRAILVASLCSGAGRLQADDGAAWTLTRTMPAAEAQQAAATHGAHVFAISSTQIAKYDRTSGERLAVSTGAAQHLNSGFVWEGKLYAAHSNFPRQPEKSEIKVLDLESMRLTTFKDFGNYGGSLTWAVRHEGYWWCNFARYAASNSQTFLVKFDDQWRELARWTYPPEVIRELGTMSVSGGIFHGRSLLATDHDHPALYELRLPPQGSVLEFVAKHRAPFTGQGIAADPMAGGLVGISRVKRQVVFAAQKKATEETIEQRCIVQIDRIWDKAAHSAFTDIVQLGDHLYCTFREGSGHIPGLNGVVRVIRSRDAANWESVALLAEQHIDLRDPKLSITPDRRLLVNMGASTYHGKERLGIASRVSFSDPNGLNFSPPQTVELPESIVTGFDWLWRVTWHGGWAWGAVQQIPPAAMLRPGEIRRLQLVRSKDAIQWEHVASLPLPAPSETTLRFQPDGTLLAMIRHVGNPAIGRIGRAQPPYKDWTFQETGLAFGGPNFVRLPSGAWLAGSRDYAAKPPTTALWRLDPVTARMRSLLTLPSSGDNSYPGFVIDGPGNRLLVSYYSGHEGKSAIYLATLRLDAVMDELSKSE
jgi:hypothetical protein